MSHPIDTINAIADHDAEACANLLKADRFAARLLRKHGERAITNLQNDYYDALQTLADALDNGSMDRAKVNLDSIDELKRAGLTEHFASDEACDRWRPVQEAAYYIGLCIGLRLAGMER